MLTDKNNDIAGKEYWDKTWEKAEIPQIVVPHDKSLGNVNERAMNRFYHIIFDKYLGKTQNKSFLEVGCGNSAFLPYMNKEFGFKIFGLDYSEIGCNMTKKAAEYYGVHADIYLCDLFEPDQNIRGKYDVVFASGVIEHFKETEKPCKAMADLAISNGIIINIIPNFSVGSLMGKLQKKYAPDIYNKHVPLDKQDLINAHEKAKLETLYCDYLLAYNYGVINFNGKNDAIRKFLVRKGKLLMLLKKNNIVGTKKYAPYIVYIGRKK